MDPRDNLDRPPDDDPERGPDLPPVTTGVEARHPRPWRRVALVTAGVAVAAGLVVIGMVLADRDDDAPPVATTPSSPASATASPEPRATSTPSPTTPAPTPSSQPQPQAPAVPALDACGTPAPPLDEAADPWVGDYGGGTDGDVMVPLDLHWSVISGEDWGGQTVTAAIVGLWLVSEDGTLVVGVPASELPESVPVAMSPGSEGAGSGSEGAIELTTEFLACPDGSGALPPAPHRARLGVQLETGTTPQPVWGDIVVFLPDYTTATAP